MSDMVVDLTGEDPVIETPKEKAKKKPQKAKLVDLTGEDPVIETPKAEAKAKKKPQKAKQHKICTGCGKRDAEHSHPDLSVAVCGVCWKQYNDASFEATPDTSGKEHNNGECLWCGKGDGTQLLMCDTCPNSICVTCCARNFGAKEMRRVRKLDTWQCYVCDPTPAFKKLQLSTDFEFFNMDLLFAAIKPPNTGKGARKPPTLTEATYCTQLMDEMSKGESMLASLFSSYFGSALVNLLIGDQYLLAQDLQVLSRVSHRLRIMFTEHVLFLPGLFKTPFGAEHNCQLFPHQYRSLQRMTEIENRTTEFGALRGGILADAPGLGKTLTVLALVVSTAGVLPNPGNGNPYSEESVNESWENFGPQSKVNMIRTALRGTIRDCMSEPWYPPELEGGEGEGGGLLPLIIRGEFATVKDVEVFGKKTFRQIARGPSGKNRLKEAIFLSEFRKQMLNFRESLDKSDRGKRKRFEIGEMEKSIRMREEARLRPSSATLIVVPMSLLEHWYEQLSRHIGLKYLVHREQRDMEEHNDLSGIPRPAYDDERSAQIALDHSQGLRGIVYFDGLGDILDISPPITKVKLSSTTKSLDKLMDPAELSQFLIVVTTFDRCALQERNIRTVGKTASKTGLRSLRWLRLIVDEGHELGHSTSKIGLDATRFIRDVAAERRWVMSGTPTTGASSLGSLMQIQKLLVFLRHSEWGIDRDDAQYRIISSNGKKVGEVGSESARRWQREMVLPFLDHRDEHARGNLVSLLGKLVIRHTKQDIKLFPPRYKTVALEPQDYNKISGHNDGEGSMNLIDEIKANYIKDMLREANNVYRAGRIDPSTGIPTRRPKIIVFATKDDSTHLQGVASYLYAWLGDSGVCEHGTTSTNAKARKYLNEARSAEISRFRKSQRKVRVCPLCQCQNSEMQDNVCVNTLFCVEYNARGPDEEAPFDGVLEPRNAFEETMQREIDERCRDCIIPVPGEGGHGYKGRGGHFLGGCLCSREGCPPNKPCYGYPNPFDSDEARNRPAVEHLAIVSAQDVLGYVAGQELTWNVNQPVFVLPRAGSAQEGQVEVASPERVATEDISEPAPAAAGGGISSGPPASPPPAIARPPLTPVPFKLLRKKNRKLLQTQARGPILWQQGIMGGLAKIRYWQKCGKSGGGGFHRGKDILDDQEWQVLEEDASVLLLQEDGSTGLDLSFATHIVLLNRVADPALQDQIVSRANRMGATGPVEVITLLCNEVESD